MRHLAVRFDLDSADLEHALRRLDGLGPDRSALDEMLRADFAEAVDHMTERMEKPDPYDTFWKPGPFFCLNRTTSRIADAFRHTRPQVALPARERQELPSPATNASWRNASGRRYRDLMVRSLHDRTFALFDEHCFQFAGVRAILALKLYRLDTGAYPEKLDALVPDDVLDSVPIDPCDARSLRYSRAARVVWSVNPDGGWQDSVVPDGEARQGNPWVLTF